LIRVEDGANILGEYTYNALGQRMTKNVNGVVTVFHYDFDGNIIAESGSDGIFKKEYLYVGSNRLAMVDVASNILYHYQNNNLGTPLLMTDSQGVVVWDAEYKPFGEADISLDWQVENNFRFAGQYYDEETGLHYNYHRYYYPGTGRYLTPDPIGLAGMDPNLYGYVLNDPVNAVDPSGLFLKQALGASIGALVNNLKYRDSWIRNEISDKQFLQILGAGALSGAISVSGKSFSSGLAFGAGSAQLNEILTHIILRDPCKEWDEKEINALAKKLIKDALLSMAGGAFGGLTSQAGKLINIPGVTSKFMGALTGLSADIVVPIFSSKF